MQNKCSRKSTCGYCSGHHQTSDQKCNIMGCMAKQESLCSHTLEMCPKSKGKLIEFSNRCAKKTEATKVAPQSRGIGLSGRVSANAASDVALVTNRVVLRHRPKGTTKEGERSEEELVWCWGRGGKEGGERCYNNRDCEYGRDWNWNWDWNWSPGYQWLAQSSTTAAGCTSGSLWRRSQGSNIRQ